MTRGWTGFRTAAIALGLIAAGASGARADGILAYHTSGGPGTAEIAGNPAISFVPVQTGSVDTASNISLGTFVVAALPNGQSTTYHHTPFSLSLIPDAFNGTTIQDNTVKVTGYLNGTVSGANQSNVRVTFDPVTTSAFSIGSGAGTLDLSNSQELLVPSSVNGGQTTLQAQVATTNGSPGGDTSAPEPSTIALFLSTLGGLGLRRMVQDRRRRAAA